MPAQNIPLLLMLALPAPLAATQQSPRPGVQPQPRAQPPLQAADPGHERVQRVGHSPRSQEATSSPACRLPTEAAASVRTGGTGEEGRAIGQQFQVCQAAGGVVAVSEEDEALQQKDQFFLFLADLQSVDDLESWVPTTPVCFRQLRDLWARGGAWLQLAFQMKAHELTVA